MKAILQPGAANLLTEKARQLREQLSELASCVGAALPVYVLFTKMDTLSYFPEYVGTLTADEAQEVFGATLPFFPASAPGASGQGQTQHISEALSDLFPVLSDRRLLYLARENDPVKSSAIYEFPREFRKLHPVLHAFLSELSRPLQLQLNPVLRGFYFTGVRPVIINDVLSAPPAPARSNGPEYKGATGIFVPTTHEEQVPLATPASRRVPQWVYLGRLFPEVILADRAALDSSKQNVKSSRVQRIALIAASLAGLALAATWTVSFLANYRLASEARNAVTSAVETQSGPGLASEAAILNLKPARDILGILDRHRAGRVPIHMRWGLYAGDDLYEPTFQSWFAGFHRLLLARTQKNLVHTLSQSGKSNHADYRSTYNALKAYLITTENPDKYADQNPREFPLSSILVDHWQSDAKLPKDDLAAAADEFDLYSDLLRRTRPWPHITPADATAVSAARTFLNHVSGAEALYQQILSHPNQDGSLIFNRLYPGSERFVVNNYPVPAAFTKTGWAVTQRNIQNVSNYFKGEEWVLGPAAFANIDEARLQKDLEARYKADYAGHWREYLRRTSVVRFANIKDAANKLSGLTSNQSPLLESLCLVSENTSVDPAFEDLFQPPHQIVPPGCRDHLASAANDAYVQALIGLQASLNALSTDETNDGLRANALQKATEAFGKVNEPASKFTIDKGHIIDVQTKIILEAPIQYTQTLISGATRAAATTSRGGKGDVNAAASAFCSQFNPLMRKYPFAPFSKQDATANEVSEIFAPNQGALWTLYLEHLQKYVQLGTIFTSRPGFISRPVAPEPPNPAFVSFLNRAAAISDALYHGGPDLKLAFDLRVVPDENVQTVSLSINGQVLTYTANNPAGQHFTWPGLGPEEIKLRVKFAGGTEFEYPTDSGTWDLFRFFEESELWQIHGNEYTMEKPLRSGNRAMLVPATGRPATVRFGLAWGSAAMVLRPGALGGLVCVAVAVK